MPAGEPRASVVVLAKDAQVAKTRLQLPRDAARELALRMTASTVRAALAAETVGAVLVVTGDADIALDAIRAGVEIVADLPRLHPTDLDAAVGKCHLDGVPLFVADHEGAGTTFLIHGPEHCPGLGSVVAPPRCTSSWATGVPKAVHGPPATACRRRTRCLRRPSSRPQQGAP